jgi:glutaminyl-peptide cyclotransferase
MAVAAALLLFAAAYTTPWLAGSVPTPLLSRQQQVPTTRFYSFELAREYPHDRDAFTQVGIFPHLICHPPPTSYKE